MKPWVYLVVLTCGVVAIVGVGIGGMVAIEWLRPEGHNTQLNTEIVGLVTLAAIQLFGLIKSVLNGMKLEEVRTDMKEAPKKITDAAELAESKLLVAADIAADKIESASKLALRKPN